MSVNGMQSVRKFQYKIAIQTARYDNLAVVENNQA